MKYGTDLKPKATYIKIFKQIKDKISEAGLKDILIEHVGGTALKTPSGKGDIDIYIAYINKKDKKEISAILNKIIGKPGKITPERVRYNLVIEGIDVEIQLTNQKSLDTAVALRDYLNKYPKEAKKYAQTVAKMRKEFLENMFKLKEDFAQKAILKK